MIYEFADFELDDAKVELRRGGTPVALQPQAYKLLLLLVENHDRLVSRDEIIDKVWDGRIVSETAIASRIKVLRRALGDGGQDQRVIRTVHGRGFRLVAEVTLRCEVIATATERQAIVDQPDWQSGRPSIAVLPFLRRGADGEFPAIEDAIPHEIIVALSRLRWLFVIARGSSFRFRTAHPDVAAIGAALGVRYCLAGTVDLIGSSISITAELAETQRGGIVWSDQFVFGRDEIHAVRGQITASVVAALETHIPLNEARRARLALPGSIDTWATYHLGIQHMYRFNSADNRLAAGHFSAALAREPEFARAHAGLSFTAFQHAYLHYSDDAADAIALARQSAQRSVDLDPLDPFGNFTLGRSYWLEGEIAASLEWLDRATTLSPNFAQGFYARAWAETMLGHGADGRRKIDAAMALSPLDPFMYAMKGTRALSYLVEDNAEAAVPWIEEAARTPGAHPVVGLVAAAASALNGDVTTGSQWVRRIAQRHPHVSRAYFFRSIPFADAALRARVARALGRCGLD